MCEAVGAPAPLAVRCAGGVRSCDCIASMGQLVRRLGVPIGCGCQTHDLHCLGRGSLLVRGLGPSTLVLAVADCSRRHATAPWVARACLGAPYYQVACDEGLGSRHRN